MTKPTTTPDATPFTGAGIAQTEQWANAFAKLSAAMQRIMTSPPSLPSNKRYDPKVVLDAMAGVASGLMWQSDKLIEIQFQAFSDMTKLWSSALFPATDRAPVATPAPGDRRFRDAEWDSNPVFNQFKQQYLIAAQSLRALVDASPEPDASKRAIVGFIVEQFLNAAAPTNFAFSNPEVLRKTVETGGANLVAGLAHLLEDLADGRGIVRRRAPSTFKLGENLATTPGAVVYQNDLMQLIQYAPTTAKVHRRPLLYVPPLVNKYYMIDLQPKSSLVRWLVEQGHTVFVISWVDPDDSHAHCEIDDYVGRGVIEAMDVVRDITGEPDADLFGFCMGGTLVAMAEAVLAARNEGDRAGTATLIGSLVDFRDMRDWAGFVNESHVNALDSHIAKRGYIDKDELQQLFAMMRANDLIWSSFVNHYLLDQDAPQSDLLFWFEHGSHIPKAFLTSYNSKLLVQNHLTDAGKVEMLGEKLDLSQIKTPTTIIGLRDDHVSAWQAVYFGARYFGGPVQFVLGGSGHNAGVINPPAANKHGYWTNDASPDRAEDWLADATRHDGSWWPLWSQWLIQQSGNAPVPARQPGTDTYPELEPAPGSYVLAGQA